MICPICRKRKASRFCPAKSASICSIDCATEREVTIDCPADCPHLIASRLYEEERREIDWSNLPFSEVKITPGAFREHAHLLDALAVAVCQFAGEQRALVDSDVIAVFETLARKYQTLAKGVYYEPPLDYWLQNELAHQVERAVTEYGREEAAESGLPALRDGTIRDALIFFCQLGATRSNGRPKGRAFLDFLRAQVRRTAPLPAEGPNLLIVP